MQHTSSLSEMTRSESGSAARSARSRRQLSVLQQKQLPKQGALASLHANVG